MAWQSWISIAALGAGLSALASLASCGGLCGRSAEQRAAMADCPCMPSGDDGYDSGGASTSGIDDEGRGRSAELRCSCGVDPQDDTGEETTTGAVCDGEAPVVLYLSADDSNSMSSPVQVREAALAGSEWVLSAVPVRPWEFFNYYDFAYPPAEAGEATVFVEMAAKEGVDDAYTVQVAVSSAAITPAKRPPVNLTLVLDTSGSMDGAPIERLKDVCTSITASLRAGDVISMVTWNTENSVILDGHVASGPDDPALLDEIALLDASGGTDLHSGLVAGYDLATKNAAADRIDRLILVSDGGANVGITDIDLIASYAGGENEEGIYMVGVGVGTEGSYNDSLMDTVTDAGKGASIYIPSAAEAAKMFSERFVSTLMVAARDVQVELELPPGFAIKRFSGEEYSTDPAEVEPQHLAPNDAMIFHQEIETCAPDLITPETPLTVTARYVDALTFEPREVSVTRTFGDLVQDPSPRLKKGTALLAYTDAMTAIRLGEDATMLVNDALAALDVADAALPGDPALTEIRQVLKAL